MPEDQEMSTPINERRTELTLNHARVRAPSPARIVREHGVEYSQLRPHTRESSRIFHSRTRIERIGSKGRRRTYDALRMVYARVPEADEALHWLLTDRRIDPKVVLEAIKLVHIRTIGPDTVNITTVNQLINNNNGTGSEVKAVEHRSPLDLLSAPDKLEYMRNISRILIDSNALLPPQPAVNDSARAIEVEVVRTGEALAPGGPQDPEDET